MNPIVTAPRRLGRRGEAPRSGVKRSDAWAGVLLTAPSFLLFATFVIAPMLGGVALAFFDWDLFGSPRFIGLDNFERLLGDDRAALAMRNTGLFVLLGMTPTVLIGFVLAALINSNNRIMRIVRVVYFVPIVVSAAVAGVLWALIYRPRYGLISLIAGLFGINELPSWLTDPAWALPALSVILVWMTLPIVIILYLAALQQIPTMLYEAAALDGAGPLRRLWSITWPGVSQMTMLVVVLEFIHFMSAPFEIALIMTQGGPLDSTLSISLYAYRLAFERGEVGYGSAVALAQLVIVAVLALAIRGAIYLHGRRS